MRKDANCQCVPKLLARADEVIERMRECLLMMLWTAPPPARECHEYGCC